MALPVHTPAAGSEKLLKERGTEFMPLSRNRARGGGIRIRDAAFGQNGRLLQWVKGKPGGTDFQPGCHPSDPACDLAVPSGPPASGHRAFRLIPFDYFFLAARPRPAGAARNEMPVRMAFC
jgi:hypothetical protein